VSLDITYHYTGEMRTHVHFSPLKMRTEVALTP